MNVMSPGPASPTGRAERIATLPSPTKPTANQCRQLFHRCDHRVFLSSLKGEDENQDVAAVGVSSPVRAVPDRNAPEGDRVSGGPAGATHANPCRQSGQADSVAKDGQSGLQHPISVRRLSHHSLQTSQPGARQVVRRPHRRLQPAIGPLLHEPHLDRAVSTGTCGRSAGRFPPRSIKMPDRPARIAPRTSFSTVVAHAEHLGAGSPDDCTPPRRNSG